MDLLSGSYSRMDKDMAGLFQVLWGDEDGFTAAKALNGTDNEPLIIPAGEEDMVKKICTRPFAADMDNDGDLDLIVGNFGGTFYTFAGEGKGKFSPTPEALNDKDDNPLTVGHHSDPFLFDWDSDGDLDIVSGSSDGGVHLAINEGDEKAYRYAAFVEVLPSLKSTYSEPKIGSEHITQPQGSTRVWIDDVNGDGKFDILVGDSVTISEPAEGVEADEVEPLLETWQEDYQKTSSRYMKVIQRMEKLKQPTETASEKTDDTKDESAENSDKDEKELTELEKLEKEMQELGEEMASAYQKRSKIVEEEMTGFVWVYYQK